MSLLETVQLMCPFCGETIDLLIDCSVDLQEYIEDCQVCCRPIKLVVTIDENDRPAVIAFNENDQ